MKNFLAIALILSAWWTRAHAAPKYDPGRTAASTYLSAPVFGGFQENKGQVRNQDGLPRPDVRYLFHDGNGYKVHLRNSGFSYEAWRLLNAEEVEADRKRKPGSPEAFSGVSARYDVHRVDVNLVGANPNARTSAEGRSPSFENFPAAPEVYKYQKVRYHQVYAGIDLVFYVNQSGAVEYDFVVAPGADVSQIKLEYQGANGLHLAENGLSMTTAFGSIEEGKIVSWNESATGAKKSAAVRPTLSGNLMTFEALDYDRTQTLVIDPVTKIWGTYFGGDAFDFPRASAKYSNFIYLVGTTESAAGIATSGAHQSVYGGNADVYLAKFNADGVLVWATYFGDAAGYDDGYGVAVNPIGGDVFITGYANSTTAIATAGTHQPANAGGADAFLAKFNPSGVQQWGTYLGGTSGDVGRAVAVGFDGSIFIVGESLSNAGIASGGAHQTAYGGNKDAFLAKFFFDGSLAFATYIGGTLTDYATAIDIAPDGSVYVGGQTVSSAGISTVGSHKENVNVADRWDGFIVEFNYSGVRQWGTYFGDEGHDYIFALKTDDDGDIYISGSTSSVSGVATAGTHQPTYVGGDDAYVAKFNPDGVQQWGTYYGGELEEYAYSMDLATDGSILISGTTASLTGISTAGAYQEAHAGGYYDAIVAQFDDAGQLLMGTYVGGSDFDESYSISAFSANNIFVSGYTFGDDGISTAGAHQVTRGGSGDMYLIKLGIPEPEPTDIARIWGTYYGGAGFDNLRGAALSPDNQHYYVTGRANSTAGIATPGAHQEARSTNFDAYLAKFTTDGALVWATYFGGTGNFDEGASVKVASDGSVYIAGTIQSNGMATPGAHQEVKGSTQDAFLAKFNSDGVLQWSTYFGGGASEQINAMDVGSDGSVYIVGQTRSTDGIAFGSVHQTVIGSVSEDDAFLAKFNPAGVLQWSTYFGGTQSDAGRGITILADGSVLITGQTVSTADISTSGAYQEAFGGSADAFLTNFDADGQLVWSTYFGADGAESGSALTTAADGSIYLAGSSSSASGVATPGAFNETYGYGSGDALLAKFTSAGVLEWATYIGTDGFDFGAAVAMAPDGTIFVTGGVGGDGNIATSNAHQPGYGGSWADAFFMQFNSAGQRLYGTFYGDDDGGEEMGGLAVADDGMVYVAGYTFDGDGFSTPGVHQEVKAGSYDAFIAKFGLACETFPEAPVITATTNACNRAVVLDAGPGYTSYLWSTGATGRTLEVSEAGTYSVTGYDGSCGTLSEGFVTSGFNVTSSNLPVVNNTVRSQVKIGNVMYLCGDFTQVGGIARNYLAAIDLATGEVTDWNPNSDNFVADIAVSPDHSTIYINGAFSSIGGQSRNRAAAFDVATGDLLAWSPSLNGVGTGIAVSPDGSLVYLAGAFTQVTGQTRNRIAAVNAATGAVTAWNPNADDMLFDIKVNQDGSKVYAAGFFTTIGGQSRQGVAEIDAATGTATSFNLNLPAGEYGMGMLLSPDGESLYLAGNFTTVAGQSRSNVAEILIADGSVTDWNPSPNFQARSFALASDGNSMFIGGNFTTVGGVARSRFAQVSLADGSLLDFNPGATSSVWTIVADACKVYLGGSINASGWAGFSLSAPSLSVSQTLINLFTGESADISVTTDAENIVWCHSGETSATVTVSPTETTTTYSVYGYYAGGCAAFAEVTVIVCPLVEISAGGTTSFCDDGEIVMLSATSDGGPASGSFSGAGVSGGEFDPIAAGIGTHVITLTLDGDHTPCVNEITLEVVVARCNAIDLTGAPADGACAGGPLSVDFEVVGDYNDGNVFSLELSDASGSFASPTVLATFEGTAPGAFNLTGALPNLSAGTYFYRLSSTDPEVFSSEAELEIFNVPASSDAFPFANNNVNRVLRDGNTLYVSGNFTQFGGQTRNRLAAIDANTGELLPFAIPGMTNGQIWAMALKGDTLFIGGTFTTVGGTSKTRLAAVNKHTGAVYAWNPTADNTVFAIAIDGDDVYFGGNFANAGGAPHLRLAKANATTGAVAAWDGNASAAVRSLVVYDGELFVGGQFTTIGAGAVSRNRLAAFDLSTGDLTSWNPGANNAVRAMERDGDELFVGGDFTNVGGQTRRRVASVSTVDGTVSAFHPDVSNGQIHALHYNALEDMLFIGGTFTGTVGGQSRTRLAAVNATTAAVLDWNPATDGTIRSLAGDGCRVFAGGLFAEVDGDPNRGFVVLDGPGVGTASGSGDAMVCAGESVEISVSGGATFFWCHSAETSATVTVSPTETTTYDVYGITASGCISAATVTVTVNPLPVADGGGNHRICEGGPAAIIMASATGAEPFEFFWSNGSSGAEIFVSPSSTTTYTLTVTDANGCSDTDEVTVTVNPRPSVSASDDVSICFGQPATLTAFAEGGTGALNVYWSSGDEGTEITVSPAQTTTYTVWADDEEGCKGYDEVTVTVLPLPETEIAATGYLHCAGGSVTLDAGAGFASYDWSTGETTQEITVTEPGYYAVTLEGANGCFETFFRTVEITGPIADAGADQTICYGATATLDATASIGVGLSFFWAPIGATGATVGVSPTATTQYTLAVIDENGCLSATDRVWVTVLPELFADAGADMTICAGGTATLSGSGWGGTGELSFEWSNGATGAEIEVSPETTTTYTLTVTDAEGCSVWDAVTVATDGLALDLGVDVSACEGATATLDAGEGYVSYLWSTGAETQTIEVSESGAYSVTVTGENGCTAWDEIEVTINAAPVVDLGDDVTTCGGTVMLDAGEGYVSYLWSTGAETQTIEVSESGTYSVTVWDLNGCFAWDEIEVTINAAPVADLGDDVTTCGGTVMLNAGEYASYLWSTGAETQTIEVSESGTYSVTVWDENGCSAWDEVEVTINAAPVADLGDNVSQCGGTAMLDAGDFAAYLWSTGAETQTIEVSEPGIYSVTVWDENGCSAWDEVEVTINAVPTVDLGDDVSQCGGTVMLDAGEYASYLWSTGAETQTIEVSESGMYSVTVWDENGCEGWDEVAVTINATPVLDLGADIFQAGGTVTLDAGEFAAYEWSTGATTQAITVAESGVYLVTVWDENGCPASDEIAVTIDACSTTVDLGADFAICAGSSAVLDAGAGFVSYEWSTGATTQTIEVSESGTYSVTVWDVNGCSGTDAVAVTTRPAITVSADVLNPSCGECADGAAWISADGGTGPYLFSIGGNGNETGTFAGLTDGTYVVTVEDENGCGATMEITLSVCPKITILSIDNLASTSARPRWNRAEARTGFPFGQFTVRHRLSPDGPWTTVTNVADTTYLISGLTASTTYQVQVAYACGSGTSQWSDIAGNAEFATLAAACTAPTAVTTAPAGAGKRLVSWTGHAAAVSYAVAYGLISQPPSAWATVVVGAPTTSHTITGLTPSASYRARVLANCTSPFNNTVQTAGSSPWSLTSATFVPNSRESEGAAAGESLAVYPNPNKGSFVVRFEGAANQTADVRLTDALGRTVFQTRTEWVAGVNDLNVDVKAASGVYALTVVSGGRARTVKLVID